MARDQWYIRGVDQSTRRKVKAYAAAHGIELAEALKQLISKALSVD